MPTDISILGKVRSSSRHRFIVVLSVLLISLVTGFSAVVVTYLTVPDHNTAASQFDALIVLGCPADPDGNPSSEQRERVMEAVREFRSGHAGVIIVSGGPTIGTRVEADAMARVALDAGVPPDRLIEERQSLNTLQNIFYSQRIMQRKNWTTVEVISSPSHLPRAGLILEHWNLGWRVRAAHWPTGYSYRRIAPYYVREALGTTALRWFGFRTSQYLPVQA